MGRAARVTRAEIPAEQPRITLEPADFYQLIAKLRHVDVLRLEAIERAKQLAAEYVQKEIASVEAEKRQLFDTVTKKYGLDPTRTYRFEEATLELIAMPPTP